MNSGKSGTSFQDKLAKQNAMSKQLLARELSKLDEKARSDIRMLDTELQRFRSRYKKLGVRPSSSSKAHDVRMYETHNPGFCLVRATEEDPEAACEVVRKMLFTGDEVDVDKIVCLHLLTALVARDVDAEVDGVNSSVLNNKGRGKPLTGAWNNLLPCYVLEIKRGADRDASTDRLQLHQDPRRVSLENATLRNFERSYENYARGNADAVANVGSARTAPPRTFGKMPIISPHVYSLLGASHELRVRQAIADGGKKYSDKRSSVESTQKMIDGVADSFWITDGRSVTDSFRLLDDDDDDGSTGQMSFQASTMRNRSSGSKSSGTKKINSQKSATGSSHKIDRSITMLKGKPNAPVEELIKTWRTDDREVGDDLVTIKPSYRFFDVRTNVPAYSANSFASTMASPKYSTRKFRSSVYLNFPVKSFRLRNEECKIVKILVNSQIQALVHSVLEVLEKVNPEKFRLIVEAAGDSGKIREIFERRDTQIFLESLVGQPIVSSPRSFVVSAATVVKEIDARLESFVGDELVATTLEIPETPIVETLIREIRGNLFPKDPKNSSAVKMRENIFSKEVKNSSAVEMRENIFSRGQNNSQAVDFPEERSKADESAPMIEYEESKPATFNAEIKRLKKSGITDRTTRDRKEPMKRKTNEFVAGNEGEMISNEGIHVLDETIKLEGKLPAGNLKKKRNKNPEISTNVKNIPSDTSKTFNSSNDKSDFKPRKSAAQDPGYLDPDRVILRRMTNEQRILVGRMCAALKNRRINNEGLIRERTPLAVLIAPVLSRESIKMLTRGTTYANNKPVGTKKLEKEEKIQPVAVGLTGPVLAKVRRDIAERETKRRLDDFFAK